MCSGLHGPPVGAGSADVGAGVESPIYAVVGGLESVSSLIYYAS